MKAPNIQIIKQAVLFSFLAFFLVPLWASLEPITYDVINEADVENGVQIKQCSFLVGLVNRKQQLYCHSLLHQWLPLNMERAYFMVLINQQVTLNFHHKIKALTSELKRSHLLVLAQYLLQKYWKEDQGLVQLFDVQINIQKMRKQAKTNELQALQMRLQGYQKALVLYQYLSEKNWIAQQKIRPIERELAILWGKIAVIHDVVLNSDYEQTKLQLIYKHRSYQHQRSFKQQLLEFSKQLPKAENKISRIKTLLNDMLWYL